MPADFSSVFSILKPVLAETCGQLQVKADTAIEYTVLTKSSSPYPKHKGEPLYFASLRLGKAYVSYHLMPLYMCPELTGKIPAGLKKRMHGNTCSTTELSPEVIVELRGLTDACLESWAKKNLL